MKTLLRLVISLVLVILGCSSPDNPFETNSMPETKVDTVQSTSAPSTNVEYASEEYITVHQQFDAIGTYNAKSFIQADRKYKTMPVSIILTNDDITFIMDDPPISWKYSRLLSANNWKVDVNSTNINLTNSDVKIVMSHAKQIEKICLGSRCYIIREGVSVVAPDPTSSTVESSGKGKSTSSRLRYLDNHVVEVMPGQYLNWIIRVYNEENGTNYTLYDIVKKNKYLSNRKNYTVMPGDIVDFR